MDRPSDDTAEPPRPATEAHKTDLRLTRAVLDGDARALDELIDRLRCVPRILGGLNDRSGRILSDAELADLGQDVLIIIWEKLRTFEGHATLETWAYRFCSLTWRNRFRRTIRRRRLQAGGFEATVENLAAPEVKPAGEFEAIEIGLEELGPPQAEVIRLKHFEGRTFDEIGDVLGLPTNTCKTHYYRGLNWLRRRMRSLGEGG